MVGWRAMRSLACSLLLLFTYCWIGESWNLRFTPSWRLKLHRGFLYSVLSTAVAISPCNAIVFSEPEYSFSFQYPEEFKISEKNMGLTVRTHKYEMILKSQKSKGFTAGLTVDAVNADNIRQFSSPEAVLGLAALDT